MLGPDDSKANIFLKKKRFLGKVMNANFLYSKYDFDMTVPLLALLSKITTLSISWLSATVWIQRKCYGREYLIPGFEKSEFEISFIHIFNLTGALSIFFRMKNIRNINRSGGFKWQKPLTKLFHFLIIPIKAPHHYWCHASNDKSSRKTKFAKAFVKSAG